MIVLMIVNLIYIEWIEHAVSKDLWEGCIKTHAQCIHIKLVFGLNLLALVIYCMSAACMTYIIAIIMTTDFTLVRIYNNVQGDNGSYMLAVLSLAGIPFQCYIMHWQLYYDKSIMHGKIIMLLHNHPSL